MKHKRRDFLKLTALTGLGAMATNPSQGFAANDLNTPALKFSDLNPEACNRSSTMYKEDLSIIGQYGSWASSLTDRRLPYFSFRRTEWSDIDAWRETARKRLIERMAIPDLGGMPLVNIKKQYTYEGLQIEELRWQLPYGAPTDGILLKPLNAKGPLPGILAFHDHSGNKYFGAPKITRTADVTHPLMKTLQEKIYEDFAWANEIAKRGYVVLVPDAFTFGSRRVRLQDVPEHLRKGLTDPTDDQHEKINAYNGWAGQHEHVMAKSLFSAGTTWPALFFAEDRKALDILCARKDVDANRIGCGGLSGGGLRTVLMGGLDDRIKCAVCAGFMTTWNDFVLHKSSSHTWMTYVPLLPNELDFPEILGLRAPLPALVLNNNDDALFTLAEMKRADDILRDVYKKADAEDHYQCSFYPGPHKFDATMQAEAFQWYDRWLKK